MRSGRAYLAKPSGVTLQQHRQDVYEEATELLTRRPAAARKYRRMTGEDLRQATLTAAWCHDIGKAHPAWQSACRRDYELYRAWRRTNGLDPNVVAASDYSRYEVDMRRSGQSPAPNLRRSGVRHEFESLGSIEQSGVEVPQSVRVAIAAHHGKLGFRHQHRWTGDDGGRFTQLWEALVAEAANFARRDRDEWTKRTLARYRNAGPRALLALADTRASMKEGGERVPPIELFAYPTKFSDLRPVQQRLLEHSRARELIVRAPTGSGKTDAALLWAEQRINAGEADRLVVAMPTRFTSNALAINVEDRVSDTGLYHSSAWHARFRDASRERGQARRRALASHRLARLLETPVTVCTIDHLLISLTGHEEAHHAIFFNLANAAVVIDEVDFYDPFVQGNLVVLLETLRLLEVPVLVMSATVPESAREFYGVDHAVVDVPAREEPHRAISSAGAVEVPDQAAGVLGEMCSRGSGIVYANTVARALAFYRWFEKRHRDGAAPRPILYHSRFTEPDKKSIEDLLLVQLGRQAWETGAAGGIAILTQIGEMSVNISAPVMLSDACPIDRLVQRMGRLVRFGESASGTCHVMVPFEKGSFYPAPYGAYEQGSKRWVPSRAMETSVKRLRELLPDKGASVTLSSSDLAAEVDKLYPAAPDLSGSPAENQRRLRSLMVTNWMILPERTVDEEEGTIAGEWKSRDIEPHATVFVEHPASRLEERGDEARSSFPFASFDELREFELEYGVSCPVRLVEKERRRGDRSRLLAVSYTVGDEQERIRTMWIAVEGGYSPQTGLSFLYENEDAQSARRDTQLRIV